MLYLEMVFCSLYGYLFPCFPFNVLSSFWIDICSKFEKIIELWRLLMPYSSLFYWLWVHILVEIKNKYLISWETGNVLFFHFGLNPFCWLMKLPILYIFCFKKENVKNLDTKEFHLPDIKATITKHWEWS